MEEAKHLIRSGDLKRVSAGPINNIAPWRHAAGLRVLLPCGNGARRMNGEAAAPEPEERRYFDEFTANHTGANISSLGRFPDVAFAPFVIVKSNHEFTGGGDGSQFQCPPHVARMVQDAPGVNEVELSERTDVGFIESGTLFDAPVRLWSKTAFHLSRAGHAVAVIIEGNNPGRAKANGSQGVDAGTGANIEERFAA